MGQEFWLKPPAPTDFRHYLQRLHQTSERALYRVQENSFSRLVRVRGRLLWLTITEHGSIDNPNWFVELPNAEASDRPVVESMISYFCSLDAPLASIHAKMAEQQALAPLAERYAGVRMILDTDPWEAAAGAIISQQLNLSFAAQLKKRLMELCGESLSMGGETLMAFPTPELVADLTVEQLRAQQFSQRKAEYLIGLAQAVAEGKLSFADLEQCSDDQVIEQLVARRGVGRWTAECILLFGMGRPNLLPAADIGLRNAVTRVYGLDHQAREDEVRTLAEAWHPWRSWVTYYLWLSLADR